MNFSEMGNTVVFEPKSWWKDDVYWLLERSFFDLFGDGTYGVFLSKKIDGKMIFTWSFWAFHVIPRLWKYGFSCSGRSEVFAEFLKLLIYIMFFCSWFKSLFQTFGPRDETANFVWFGRILPSTKLLWLNPVG